MTAVVCLSLYAVIVAGLLLANHRWHRMERTVRITGPYPWCVPVRPPVTQAQVDATWLDQWPSAVDDDDLCDREFTSLISTTWEWPDTAEGAA